MPVTAVFCQVGRKSMANAFRVQSGLHINIFCNILFVVIDDETAVFKRAEGDDGENCQRKTNQ